MIIACALLCTVHGRVNAMYRSIEYLLPPVTVQDIVPPRHKNKHTPDNLSGKCPMIVPVFFYSHGIDLSTLNVVWLIHSSTSPVAASSHLFIYMLAANATMTLNLLQTPR